ncbi:hypothetical protein BDW74DRAFT_183782 [Aspergillus multicolor]|uniref:uncharacterized protein n=1 Tax=Aspergillus multicolor TaxID=41759 RepID=UPI003CCCD29C
MTSQDKKRMTQFDLASLRTRAGSPSPATPGSQIIKRTQPKLLQGKPKELVLPSVVAKSTSAAIHVPVQDGSPWERYHSLYSENIGGPATVVIHEHRPQDLLVVRTHNSAQVPILRGRPHENIIEIKEALKHNGGIYVLHEYLPLSLDRLVGAPIFPNEVQLASILGQLLDGLLHLESNTIQVGSLQCSEILLSLDGQVKISALDFIPASSDFQSRNVELLRQITLELMEGPAAAQGPTGVRNLDRWPPGSDAVDFVSAITSAAGLGDLRKHPLISSIRWGKCYLVWLVHYMVKTTWNGCGICE